MTTTWNPDHVTPPGGRGTTRVTTAPPPSGVSAEDAAWQARASELAEEDAPLAVVPPADPLAEAKLDVQEGVHWMLTGMGPWVLGAVALAQLLYVAAIGLPLAKVLLVVAFVGQAFALRWYVVNPALAAMRNRGRRFVSRQVSRGLWLVFGAWGYTMGLVPIGGLISVALAWFGLTWGIGRYLTWNLEREVAGLPVHRTERIGLTALAVGGAIALVVLVSVAALVGLLVSTLMTWIGGMV